MIIPLYFTTVIMVIIFKGCYNIKFQLLILNRISFGTIQATGITDNKLGLLLVLLLLFFEGRKTSDL